MDPMSAEDEHLSLRIHKKLNCTDRPQNRE
jgi:hypothetical protein